MHTLTQTSSMWVVGDIKKRKEAASAAATEENNVLQFNLHKLSKQMDYVGQGQQTQGKLSKIPTKKLK